MGAYLNKPVTTKVSANGSLSINGQDCPYGVTAMQGWRVGMEDAYTVVPEFDEGPLLAVFDGHGGREVAIYCSKYFPDFLRASKSYQNGDISRGLCEVFMDCDRKLLTKGALDEMKVMSEHDLPISSQDDDASGDELEQLSREADMPLENVLQACMEDKKLLKYLVNVANKDSGDDKDESNDEDESGEEDVQPAEGEGHKSQLYKKFIKELTSQYKPALNELQEMIGEDSDSSSSKEEEEEEEDIQGNDKEKEENKMLDNITGNHARDDIKSFSGLTTILRKRTRSDCNETVEDKRLKVEEEEKEEEEVVRDTEGFESGTTSTVCLVRKNTIVVANAGDSRCILSSNGEAIDLSLDHKPTDPIEKERIEKAGGHVDEDLRVDGGLNMSRAIGDHMYKLNDLLPLEEQMISAYPDVQQRLLSPEDEFLVLASDGIWNCMESTEVVRFIRNKLFSRPRRNDFILSSICEELCEACLAEDVDNDGTGCDNMTVILTLLKPLEKLVKKSE